MGRLPATLASVACLLALSATAHGRAPTTSEAPSRGAVLARMEADRVADSNKQPEEWEKLVGDYQAGTIPLADWAGVTRIVKDKDARPLHRFRSTEALKVRMALELTRGTDARILGRIRNDIAREVLDLMVRDDSIGHQCLSTLLIAYFPNPGIDTNPGTDKSKRVKAYQAWQKKLKD